MKVRIYIGYVMIGTTYVATLLSILLGCRPIQKNWQINPDPGSETCSISFPGFVLTSTTDVCQPAISRIDCLVTVVLNVVTDLYLISIPLPVSYKNYHLVRY